MKLKEAKEITGGLSNPSKMPGKAYSIPASRCNVGSRLAKLVDSVGTAKFRMYLTSNTKNQYS